MKLKNIRIRLWRKYVNSCKAEEMRDIYCLGGGRALRKMKGYVPPATAYEKWIYVNESARCKRTAGGGRIRFLLRVYIGKDDSIRIGRQHYRKYKVEYCSELKDVFKVPEPGSADYIIFIDGRFQMLSEDALREFSDMLDRKPYDFVYSDQDEMDLPSGDRKNPFFKPDWSPDTFDSFFYTGNLAAYRMAVLDPLRMPDETSFEVFHYEFTRHFLKKCTSIGHLPEVLCHEIRPYQYIEPKSVVCNRGIVRGKVSVIIPSKDHAEMLERCIEAIRNTCASSSGRELSYEIIVIDNGSCRKERNKIEEMSHRYGFRYLYEPMEFNFSKMCNRGADLSSGDFLLFLNDDIEACTKGWMERMAGQAAKEKAGAVGAKLYYPGGRRIQHLGIVNLAVGPGHCFLECDDKKEFYYRRNRYNYNFLAVTGACMMIRKAVFQEVGGFDEELAIAYNDVELCFRLYKKGYFQSVCMPAVLYHHESASRGYDNISAEKEARLAGESAILYKKHPDLYQRDPFYSPNFTPYLGEFEINLDYYGCREESIPPVPLSRVRRLYWDIRPEWLNPALVLQIDYMETENGTASIRGWAYIYGKDNFRYIRRVILKDQKGRLYQIGTRSRYRRYLREAFPQIKGMEMLAFTCNFRLEELGLEENEKYQIGMLAESMDGAEIYMIFTDQILKNGED